MMRSAPVWRYVWKRADETINNDAVLSADSALVIPLAASTNYQIEGKLFWSGTATADIKTGLSGPAAMTLARVFLTGQDNAGNTLHQTYSSLANSSDWQGISAGLSLAGLLRNGVNAGNFAITWCQGVAEVSNLTVYAGSYLRYRVVG